MGGRFPHKQEHERCYAQLHCVCGHLSTYLWFDVIRFWDRDPTHKWTLLYPDPDLVQVPNACNFDLAHHTEWLKNEAAPGGKSGYSCPLRMRGTVPEKLFAKGVRGDFVGSGEPEEEEEA